jgi:hypothetical protein
MEKLNDVVELVQWCRSYQTPKGDQFARMFELTADAIESQLARVAELSAAVEAEREACAALCDYLFARAGNADECADAIRQRAGKG